MLTRFTTTLIGALIGTMMFAAVGIGMAHAHTVDQQTGVVVFGGD